jgi:hypothetical protein
MYYAIDSGQWGITWPITVAFSTLFTCQHFLADMLGGFVVPLIGYQVSLRWAGFDPLRHHMVNKHLL